MSNILQKLITLHKLEVETEELQKIPFQSYTIIIEHILKECSKNVREFESIKQLILNLIASLISIRIEKIVKKIKNGQSIDPNILLEEERKIINPLIKIMEWKVELKIEELCIISFKKPFPIIKLPNKSFGPFNKFDIITLPKDDVKELIQKDIVEIV